MSLEALSDMASQQKPITVSENKHPDNESILPLPVPTFYRQSSTASTCSRPGEWVRKVTVEERKTIRERIKSAYRKRISSYEELLETCAAIEEELLFGVAPSRLDYFKSGIHFEARVSEKLTQLEASRLDPASTEGGVSSNGSDNTTSKRVKVEI